MVLHWYFYWTKQWGRLSDHIHIITFFYFIRSKWNQTLKTHIIQNINYRVINVFDECGMGFARTSRLALWFLTGIWPRFHLKIWNELNHRGIESKWISSSPVLGFMISSEVWPSKRLKGFTSRSTSLSPLFSSTDALENSSLLFTIYFQCFLKSEEKHRSKQLAFSWKLYTFSSFNIWNELSSNGTELHSNVLNSISGSEFSPELQK